MKTWQRRVSLGVGSIVLVLVLLVASVYGMSAAAIGAGHAGEVHPFSGAIGNAAEGARLSSMYGCTHCHTPDLGGMVMIDDMPFARLPAPNLTAGAEAGALTDVEFEQAVRHGIGRDGRKLMVMPSSEYTYLSDQDIADILAWIRTQPAVDRQLAPRAFGPVGRTLIALGKVSFQPEIIAADPDARHMERPDASDAKALGYYYTRLCTGCHGLDLAGAPPLNPAAPPGPSLRSDGNLANWTLDEFRTVFATGRTPEGKQLDPEMPWAAIGQARADEIDAIWNYLRSLPAPEGTS